MEWHEDWMLEDDDKQSLMHLRRATPALYRRRQACLR